VRFVAGAAVDAVDFASFDHRLPCPSVMGNSVPS